MSTPRGPEHEHARDPLRNPYFGELHVHTAWSLDAFVLAALNGPDEAFRYAKGDPARSSLNNAEQNRLSRPLDFAAVTEHAEWLGEYGLIVDPDYHPEDPAARAMSTGTGPPGCPARTAGPATCTPWWRWSSPGWSAPTPPGSPLGS